MTFATFDWIAFLQVALLLWVLWAVGYAVVVGVGLIVRRVAGYHQHSVDDVILSFWLGWGLIISFLQIWHLFAPVTFITTVIVCLIGTIGVVSARQSIWHLLSAFLHKPYLIGSFIFIMILMVFYAIVANANYDDGLYHIQDVMWINQYAIVPGLANLHGRFGFNTTHSLFVAVIETISFILPARHITHGIFFLAFMAPVLYSLYQVISRQSQKLEHYFYLLVFPIVLIVSKASLATIKNDYIVMLLGFVIGGYILHLSQRKEKLDTLTFMTLILLAFVSVTIKVSIGIFSLGILILLLTDKRRLLQFGIPIFMLVMGVWMLRSVIISGYPIYPYAALSVPVEWRLSPQQVTGELNSIREWVYQEITISEGSSNRLLALLEYLFQTEWYSFTLPLLMGVASYGILIATQFYKRQPKSENLTIWFLPFLSIIAIVYWVVSAPAMRFAWHSLWTFGASSLLVMLYHRGWFNRRLLLLIICIISARFIVMARWNSPLPQQFPLAYNAEYVPQRTLSGLEIFTPVTGDQCWDAPLPCAPSANPNLRLRDENSLGSGFINSTNIQQD